MKRRKNKKPPNIQQTDAFSDDNFAFIAGYTSGGAPYGITCEEWEANDQSGCALIAPEENDPLFLEWAPDFDTWPES